MMGFVAVDSMSTGVSSGSTGQPLYAHTASSKSNVL
jgi:hypothetical protein